MTILKVELKHVLVVVDFVLPFSSAYREYWNELASWDAESFLRCAIDSVYIVDIVDLIPPWLVEDGAKLCQEYNGDEYAD